MYYNAIKPTLKVVESLSDSVGCITVYGQKVRRALAKKEPLVPWPGGPVRSLPKCSPSCFHAPLKPGLNSYNGL